jgi:hypothetical protein
MLKIYGGNTTNRNNNKIATNHEENKTINFWIHSPKPAHKKRKIISI